MGKFTILILAVIGLNITITAQQPDFQKGLLVYYPLNGTTADASGNGHHGSANGVSSTINRFDDPNSASVFNGAVNILSFSGMQLQSSNITICGWLMVTDENADTVFKYITPANNMFLLRVVNHNYQVEIHLEGTNKIVYPNYSGINEIDPSHPRFDFLFLSFIDNRLTFGINNGSMSQPLDDQLVRATFPYTIKNNPVVTINGVLDEMRIYNRYLSDEERTILYFAPPRFTSFSIGRITQTSVNVESTLKTLGGAAIIERGIKWDTKPDIDSLSHKIIVNTDTGRIITNITGLVPYTTYYLRAYAISSTEIYEDQLTLKFTTLRDMSDATLTDIDGNRYHTVKIGTQTWMAENLKTTKYADGTPIGNGTIDNEEYGKYYFIYNNDSSSIDTYGLYYTWMAAANSEYGKTFPNGIQGACPDGWHLPNYAEQKALINYLGGPTVAGGKLKEPGIAHWNAPNTGATNVSGFGALGSGVRRNNYSDGEFSYTGDYTAFWGSESTFGETFEGKIYSSIVLNLYNESEGSGAGRILSTWASSVRCLKDTTISYVEIPEIITLPVTDISGTTVTTGGKLIKDGGAIQFNSQGICWSTNPHPDTSDFKTVDKKDFSYKNLRTFSNTLTGLEPNTKYYARAYVANSAGVGYGNELSFITKPDSLRGTVSDIDGNVYKTIKIGNQVWMGENLRTTHFTDGDSIQIITNYDYWSLAGGGSSPDLNAGSAAMGWYQNDSINYTYGALYNWKAVDSKKLCPSGWHAPTLYEWTELENYLSGPDIAGGKMKATGTDFWINPNTGATNESGFSALPGGFRQGLNGDSRLGYIAKIWTSTDGYLMNLENTKTTLTHTRVNNKYGSSVRCIEDSPDAEKTLPVISADSVYSIGAHAATIKSSIKNTGGSNIIETGICWSTSPDPDINDNKLVSYDITNIVTNITGLTSFTTFYAKAYAINSLGVGYSNQLSFTTFPLSDLQTGLLAYYPFSGNANDVTGNGHDAIVKGATLIKDRFGMPNSAYYFNKGSATLPFIGQHLEHPLLTVTWWIMVTDENADTVFRSSFGKNFQILLRVIDHKYQFEFIVKDKKYIIYDKEGTNTIYPKYPRFDFMSLRFHNNEFVLFINNHVFSTSIKDPFIIDQPLDIKQNINCYINGAFDDIRIYETMFISFLTGLIMTDTITKPPVLDKDSIIKVTKDSAVLSSKVIATGGSELIETGFLISKKAIPNTLDTHVLGCCGSHDIQVKLSGLTPNTTYYVQAYASNYSGYGYGNVLSFTTLPEVNYGSASDIDGNTYKTVKIGTQTWMAENLKTTKYADGTPIPLVTNNSQWISLSSGAYCWYNNDPITNADKYGALYNWYTVNTEKLCPTGWNVPTDKDWRILENYLIKSGFNYDGTLTENKIAKSLSSAFDWSISDSNGAIGNADYPTKRNSTNFTALPGGFRYYLDGRFVNQGQYGSFWSATETEIYTSSSWYRLLYYDASDLRRQYFEKTDGFSVRCLKQEQGSTDSIDLQKGLIAYYSFNGNANDESGYYHHGTVNGATLTTDRFGNPNNAYHFNGQGNSISINTLNVPSSTTTISCWVKNETANGIQNFISKHDDASNVELLVRSIDNKYAIEWTIGGTYFTLSDNEGEFTIDPNNPRFDLLVLVYDGQQVRFYVNSILIASHSISGQIAINNVPLVFGRYAGKEAIEEYFNGTLDDIRIYNRALNEKEIQALYNNIGLNASPILGDIDSNHFIQFNDASLTLQYSVGLDPLPSVDPLPWENSRIAVADVDNQNGITAYDASLILQYEAGLIKSFPVEDAKKSLLSPQADIDVSLENGFVTIRPVGELYGFNLNITGNTDSFGSPEILDRGFISAVNVTPGNYSVGLASANAPTGNDIIMKIPLHALPTQQVTVDLMINNKARQYVLGLPTDAPEASQKAVEFYPNPANTIVYFRNLSKDALVTIYDLRGRVLIKTKVMNDRIDISSWADGVYFIHIRNDANTIIRKLMKE